MHLSWVSISSKRMSFIEEKGYENYQQKENVLIFYQNLSTNSPKERELGEFVCEFAQNTAQISF